MSTSTLTESNFMFQNFCIDNKITKMVAALNCSLTNEGNGPSSFQLRYLKWL